MYDKEIYDEALSLNKAGIRYNEIRVLLNIPRSSVQSMIRPCHKQIYEHPGQPKIRNKAFKETVKRKAIKLRIKNKRITSSKVKIAGNLPRTCRTIRKTLNEVKFSFINSKQKVTLTEKQRNVREEHIADWLRQGINFKTVIFTDEKKFNLDGPDNFKNWEIKNEKSVRLKRPFGGGCIMAYGAVMPSGEIYQDKFEGTVNSDTYFCSP